MHFTETESELLKTWITKKLEDISDADSDVLADYVLALVKTEDSQPVAKANVTENLKDFLGESADTFVEDLFQTITTKSFDPTHLPPLRAVAPVYQPPKRQSIEPSNLSNGTRKRSYSYHDWDREEDANEQIQSYQGGERPIKHARRGGRGYDQRGGRHSFMPTHQYGVSPQSMPQMPRPPPGMPPFDPNNPLASMLAFQQAMNMFSGVSNGASPPNGQSFGPPPMRQRCRDYDIKGFCAAGASCPYEHGEDTFVVPRINHEYDPANSTLLDVTPTRVGHVDTSQNNGWQRGVRGRGRGRGGSNFRGGGKRSDFSMMGSSRDKSNMTIVVEQIPAESCDEDTVRSFFEEFGNIEDVTLYADKKVAVIKYDTHEAAKNAYESPKVVFDNRFVKVYWHKPTSAQGVARKLNEPAQVKAEDGDEQMVDGEPSFDMEELTKRQEEAQRKHEEAKKQREEAARQKQDLDAKLKAIDEERKKAAALLAKKSGIDSSPTRIETETKESDQTKALKAQLAKVEAEARSLGLDPNDATLTTNGHSSYYSPRGRGGYRARGRGRGSYRGYRGAWAGPPSVSGAVKRLDNRPKTVAVTFAEGNYENHDEALRQFLLFNSLDSGEVGRYPEREDSALITFNHRYEGEMFMAAASGKGEVPHVGKVELGWYKMDSKDVATNGSHYTHDSEMKVERVETAEQLPSDAQVKDEYDVVEEEDLDRWS